MSIPNTERVIREAIREYLGLLGGEYWDSGQSVAAATALAPVIKEYGDERARQALRDAADATVTHYVVSGGGTGGPWKRTPREVPALPEVARAYLRERADNLGQAT